MSRRVEVHDMDYASAVLDRVLKDEDTLTAEQREDIAKVQRHLQQLTEEHWMLGLS